MQMERAYKSLNWGGIQKMDNPASYVYRKSMWTLFWAFALGGLCQMLGTPGPWPAVIAGVVFVGIPAVALCCALRSFR